MLNAWKSLLMGRKFWLAMVALLQTCVFAFTDVPAQLWLSVDALLVAVIVTVAWEDSAMKAAGNQYMVAGEPGYQSVIESLMRSRKVWLAIVGMAQTFLFYFIPNFPQEVWLSINGVLIIVMGTIAWEDSAVKRYS